MDEAGRRSLLAQLESSRAALLDAVAGVSPEEALPRPVPGAWSILDCVEHVATTEAFLLRGITQATPLAEPAAPGRLEQKILSGGANRTRKFEAPEAARPRGRFASLADAVAGFERARGRTARYVAEFSGDLRASTTVHPLLGAITCYECVLLMVTHALRHAAQIEEIKAAGRRTAP